jgi:hypothetical protein
VISEAINVSSIYLEHGTIMSAVERNQPRRVYEAQGDAIAARIPMVVLVDHGTASSAEIVTAALQDHGRAEVVGTPTYGKGVFQVTERLNNGGAIDLTIGQFFTPDGHNLGGGGGQQGAGIMPNVEAPAEDEALATAERTVAAESIRLALDRLLQLAGDLVGSGVETALDDLVRIGHRPVEALLERRLAGNDQSRLAARKLSGRLLELLAGQRAGAERLGNEPDPWPVHALDDVRLVVLAIDHGGVEFADHRILVQLLDPVEIVQRLVDIVVQGGVQHHVVLICHGSS